MLQAAGVLMFHLESLLHPCPPATAPPALLSAMPGPRILCLGAVVEGQLREPAQYQHVAFRSDTKFSVRSLYHNHDCCLAQKLEAPLGRMLGGSLS